MDVRQVNAKIASAYDAVPYDTMADEGLDPARVLGLGAVYGARAHFGDVLDIGCGTGGQLRRAGDSMTGRLVGLDISADACRRARTALAVLGGRAEIREGDLLDVTPGALGHFDLVYCVGTLFVVPPEVRRHILALIAGSLKPGGVAVLGYYAGALDALRANIHRTLRAAVGDEPDPVTALARARAHLEQLLAGLPPPESPQRGLLEAAIRETRKLPDVIFYHEVLNQAFDALQTSELARVLAEKGIGFASYLAPVPFAGLTTARERAVAADMLDYCWGSYRHAVFVQGAGAPDLKRSQLLWTTSLITAVRDLTHPVPFRAPDGQTIAFRDPATAAMLIALSEQPLSFGDALAQARRAISAQGLTVHADQETRSLAEFARLRAHAYVSPRLKG
jgi:SAM-dependent methyltransferase